MTVRVSDSDGVVLEEKQTTPLGFREMLRHPRLSDHGWRGVGCCWFKIVKS